MIRNNLPDLGSLPTLTSEELLSQGSDDDDDGSTGSASGDDSPAGISQSTNVRITAEQGDADDVGVQATTLSGQGANTATERVATDAVYESADDDDDPVRQSSVNAGSVGLPGIERLEQAAANYTGSAAGDTSNTAPASTDDDGLSLRAIAGVVLVVGGAAVAAARGGD